MIDDAAQRLSLERAGVDREGRSEKAGSFELMSRDARQHSTRVVRGIGDHPRVAMPSQVSHRDSIDKPCNEKRREFVAAVLVDVKNLWDRHIVTHQREHRGLFAAGVRVAIEEA